MDLKVLIETYSYSIIDAIDTKILSKILNGFVNNIYCIIIVIMILCVCIQQHEDLSCHITMGTRQENL